MNKITRTVTATVVKMAYSQDVMEGDFKPVVSYTLQGKIDSVKAEKIARKLAAREGITQSLTVVSVESYSRKLSISLDDFIKYAVEV